MKIFSRSTQLWLSSKKKLCPCGLNSLRQMSSSEISAALRPFYFSVHPDLFGKYPTERAVNENSLKLLSSFIENVRTDKRNPSETTLTFYLKPANNREITPFLKPIKIKLNDGTIQKTVFSILSSCNLSTSYVDNLQNIKKRPLSPSYAYDSCTSDNTTYSNAEYAGKRTLKSERLGEWLHSNIEDARDKLKKCKPVREEISRLQSEISQDFGISQLILDCGWNISHYRGCLASFQVLAHHHPREMGILKGKTVIFGRDTGISFDGHILLNSGEVRHNWLDFIKNIPKEETVLLTLPSFEKSVSRVLRDIKVVRRKFQPKTMAKKYESNLRRLTTTVSDHVGRYGFPKTWPESLSDYELVVETEAGPLMVSPTGQFIVPASCPSFLLVNFITDNLEEAKHLNRHYQSHKHIERDLQEKCIKRFELSNMQKDDSIPPDLMISCCSRLLRHKDIFGDSLKNAHLYVANYYSVMSDGQLCIPWNWNS